MKHHVAKAFSLTIPKIYLLVYSIVAVPMVYYGLTYIELVKNNISITLPLFGLVMTASVLGALYFHRKLVRLLHPFLGKGLADANDINEGRMLKRMVRAYPARLSVVMFFGWTVLLNLLVFIPAALFLGAPLMEVLICNILVFSCALMSLPMTWFIAENSTASFLELPQVIDIPEEENTFRLTLNTKMLAVCMVIISTLILNTLAAFLISMRYELSLRQTMLNMGIISVLGVLDTLVISFIFARSMKKSAETLRAGTEALKEGSLLVRIPRLANDELGDSSSAFNEVLSKLSAIVRGIQRSVEATVSHVSDLGHAMEETDISANDIDLHSAAVQESINSQSAIINEVSATIQQIARTIENQDKKVNDQTRSVSESSSAIEEMIANIRSIAQTLERSSREFNTLQTAIQSGNGTVEDLKSNVTTLSKQSDSVFEANTIIKNIAAQTNLLAMNAAIEAAHAGESGRGFAVVADEIRKLAEVSNQQSKVISESLKVLKQSIDRAVSMTGATGSSFESIMRSVDTVTTLETEIKHAIEEQSSGSAQILHALNDMNDITAEVHNGSAEMLTGSRMIIEEVAKLLDMTTQVNATTLEVTSKANTVTTHTRNAVELLEQTAQNIRQIDDQVRFFTVSPK